MVSSWGKHSYFDQSELDEPGSLGHLDEEGRLVGVVFDNGVVHVDENPTLAFLEDFPNSVCLQAVLL